MARARGPPRRIIRLIGRADARPLGGVLAKAGIASLRSAPGHDRGEGYYAAALRLIATRASTVATVSSTVLLRMPFCAAIICTRRSVRSILGAPLKSARAAEDGRTRLEAAAAYFSNGTRSSRLAPSLTQTSMTKL